MICNEQKSVCRKTFPAKDRFLRNLRAAVITFPFFATALMTAIFFHSPSFAQDITEVVPLVSKYLYELRGDKGQEGELNQPAGLALDRDGKIGRAHV